MSSVRFAGSAEGSKLMRAEDFGGGGDLMGIWDGGGFSVAIGT